MNAQPNVTELLAQVEALKAQLANAAKHTKHTLKVGKSGTVCLYHGARYPIAKYASEWEHLIPFIKSGAIERFIEANRTLLAADRAAD